MRCENAGSDYDENNIQWTCKADTPDYFKLGATDVICEGYSSPDDPYILKGSCGVEYRLLLTEKGEAKYGKSHSPSDDENGEGPSLVPAIFWILFAAVVIWMIYSAVKNLRAARRRNPPRRPGTEAGGRGPRPDDDDDDDDDAPPPYTPYADDKPNDTPPSSSRQHNQGSSSQGSSSRWQPGFGSGVAAGTAAGAAGGYLYGQRERTRLEADLQYEREQRRREAELHRQEQARQQRELRDDRARRARDALRRDSDSSSGGTQFHSTTGFGETRRR
jgi:hypothetical protein